MPEGITPSNAVKGPVEQLWDVYFETELRKKLYSSQMVGELRDAYMHGAWTLLEFTRKTREMPEKPAIMILNKIVNELKSYVRGKQVASGRILDISGN